MTDSLPLDSLRQLDVQGWCFLHKQGRACVRGYVVKLSVDADGWDLDLRDLEYLDRKTGNWDRRKDKDRYRATLRQGWVAQRFAGSDVISLPGYAMMTLLSPRVDNPWEEIEWPSTSDYPGGPLEGPNTIDLNKPLLAEPRDIDGVHDIHMSWFSPPRAWRGGFIGHPYTKLKLEQLQRQGSILVLKPRGYVRGYAILDNTSQNPNTRANQSVLKQLLAARVLPDGRYCARFSCAIYPEQQGTPDFYKLFESAKALAKDRFDYLFCDIANRNPHLSLFERVGWTPVHGDRKFRYLTYALQSAS